MKLNSKNLSYHDFIRKIKILIYLEIFKTNKKSIISNNCEIKIINFKEGMNKQKIIYKNEKKMNLIEK